MHWCVYCTKTCKMVVTIKTMSIIQIIETKSYLPEAESRFREALYILDYKFLLIPLVFFFLRVWACIQLMLHYYIGVKAPLPFHITLNYLAVS